MKIENHDQASLHAAARVRIVTSDRSQSRLQNPKKKKKTSPFKSYRRRPIMMAEAMTGGVHNKHTTTAFYLGEMPIGMRKNLDRNVPVRVKPYSHLKEHKTHHAGIKEMNYQRPTSCTVRVKI